MSAGEIDLQPDVEDVLQEETPEPAIAVRVEGPVRTQALPRKAGASFTKTITTVAERVLRQDPYRAVAYVTSFDQDVYLAFNTASAQDTSRMCRWPRGVPFLSEAATDIWVASVTGTTAVSVSTELWATGEVGA
jgi:hypothetical protein